MANLNDIVLVPFEPHPALGPGPPDGFIRLLGGAYAGLMRSGARPGQLAVIYPGLPCKMNVVTRGWGDQSSTLVDWFRLTFTRGDRSRERAKDPAVWFSILLILLGGAMSVWHVSVLMFSLSAPIIAILGTTILLILSVLVLALGLWLQLFGGNPTSARRLMTWVIGSVVGFGRIGGLVAFHLKYMLPRFDAVPLVADLVTVGAVMGILIGQYDIRSRQYQFRMREERDRFASLFDNLPHPGVHYGIVDGDLVVSEVNEAFLEAFAVTGDDIPGAAIDDLVAPDPPATGTVDVDGLHPDTNAVQTDVRWLTAAGLRDFQLSIVPYRDDEGFFNAVDVTDQKQHIRRLGILNRVLRHDLRTDANVIVGMADLLPDSTEAAAIKDRAIAMANRGETARRIDSFLDDSMERRSMPLDDLLRDRIESVEAATVHTDIRSVTVVASPALSEAIGEILENAVEHSDLPEPEIWVSVNVDEEFAEIEIADNGPGVPAMERSVADADEETPLQHSSGLGLWLVRLVIEDLGGAVAIDDRNARGTTVSITIPR